MTRSFFICTIWLMATGCAMAHSIDPAMVGYWSFDEGTGIIAHDASSNENDGTLINGPTWTEGIIGKALEFDGIDDYVTIPDSPSLHINGNGISFMAWIYSPGFHDYGWIMGKANNGSDLAWEMLPQANLGVRYWIKTNGSATEIETPPILSVDKWQLVAVVYDGSYMRFYVDGVVKDSTVKTGNLDINDGPLWIGIDAYWPLPYTNYFYGKIDEVRVYSRALSSNEIRTEFRSVFACGDANGSGTVNISDAVYLIAYIFSGGPAPSPLLAGDANCSGSVNISDAVYLIAYIFSGGPAPCAGC